MILIRLENLLIGRFDIDGKKQLMYGKPMLVSKSPLTPRQHIKYLNKVRKEKKERRDVLNNG